MVSRKYGENQPELNIENLCGRYLKYGGEGFMVWKCTSAKGVGKVLCMRLWITRSM